MVRLKVGKITYLELKCFFLFLFCFVLFFFYILIQYSDKFEDYMKTQVSSPILKDNGNAYLLVMVCLLLWDT